MKAVIERILINSIAIAIASVLAIALISIWQSKRRQDTAGRIKHTNQVLYQTLEVLDISVKYELTAKNFLLTGDRSFLDSLNRQVSLLHNKIAGLKNLTTDNSLQQARIDSLLQYVDRNGELLDKAIGLRQSIGLAAASELLTSGRETEYSHQVQSIIDRLESEETRLLDLHRKTGQRRITQLQEVLWLLIAVVVILAVGIFQKIRMDLLKEKKVKEQLSRFSRDLEEQVRIQTAELAASNAELERFAYIASHDLQEPLRMVSSFVQLLQKKYQGQLDEKANQYIHYAIDGAERMKALIMDLLEYSRVGSGKENFEQVEVNGVVEEVTAIFREKILSTRARIEIDPLPAIRADKMQLTQLFQNLVGNALKYHGPQSPVIRISAKEQPGYWQFAVEDNGIGIDSLFFEKIFIIFQRLHNKNEYSGTGIGLAVCKKIAERHGGKIWVESTPGKGSAFFFTISKFK